MNRSLLLEATALASGVCLVACPSGEYAKPAHHNTVHEHARSIVSSATCSAEALVNADNVPTPSNRLPLRLETTVQRDPAVDTFMRLYPPHKSYLLHLGHTSIIGFDVRAGRKDTHDTNSIKRSLTVLSIDNPVAENAKNTVIFEPLKNHRTGDKVAVYLERVVDIDDFRTVVTGLSPCGILEHTGNGAQPWELQTTPDELQPYVYEEERIR